jgi:hypothetical protein
MNGKDLCSFFSKSSSVLKEYIIARHHNSKQTMKLQKLCRLLTEEKNGSVERGYKGISSKNDSLAVLMNCGQVIVLLLT